MNDMMDDYMKNYAKQLKELNYDIQRLQIELLRHLLLVAASLLAILVSLYSNSGEGNLQRWVFAVLSVVLALCILTAAVGLYAQLHYIKQAKELYVSSSIKAAREGVEAEPVFVPHRKVFSICQTASYVCFVLAVLLMALYAVLLVFP